MTGVQMHTRHETDVIGVGVVLVADKAASDSVAVAGPRHIW